MKEQVNQEATTGGDVLPVTSQSQSPDLVTQKKIAIPPLLI